MVRFNPCKTSYQKRKVNARTDGPAGVPSMVKLSDQALAKQPLDSRLVTWHRSGEAPSEPNCESSPQRTTWRGVTPALHRLKAIAT